MMRKLSVSSVVLCAALVSCQATTGDKLSSADEKIDKTTVASVEKSVVDAGLETGDLNGVAPETFDVAKTESTEIEAKTDTLKKDSEVASKEIIEDKKIDTTTVASIEKKKKSWKDAGVVDAYVPPKKGTLFTWRNNWASLPKLITYKVDGVVKLAGKEYVKLSATKGLKKNTQAYYDTSDFSLKGYRDAANKVLVAYKPAEQRYRFPMKPGDKWVTSWKSKDYKENKVTSGGGVVQVIKFETISTAAGKFETVKVKMPLQKDAPKRMTHYVWFSPKLGVTVKEQIGAGSMNWTQVLEKVQFPS